MSDNDLIRRGDAFNTIKANIENGFTSALATIAAIPAVVASPVLAATERDGFGRPTDPAQPHVAASQPADTSFDDMACVADDWMHKYEEAKKERDDAMALFHAADKVHKSAKSELRNVEFGLADPVAVHANMLRGTIAKPTVSQIIHLYGADAIRAALPADPVRVTVKPLAWQFESEEVQVATSSAWHQYRIIFDRRATRGAWMWFSCGQWIGCETEDAAKAAAQADYEARILAAIDVQPDPRDAQIAAMVEAAEHLLLNYLQDEFDEPDLCLNEEHWLAISELRAAVAAVKGGDA